VAYLSIIRPLNCGITLISVFVGGWIGKSIHFSTELVAAGIIGFIVCAFGNVVNDIYDIEIDRINNPQRPLPSGRAKKKVALLMALIFLIIALAGSFFLGVVPFIAVITALVLLFLYSAYLKKTLAGNIVVALTAGLSFVFGGLVARNPACVIPFVFSIFIHLPREIVKDIIDMKGDKMTGATTLPVVAGITQSYTISAIFLGFLFLLLPIPFIINILSVVYIIIILLIAYPILLYIIWRLMKRPALDDLPLISNLMKAAMAAGLAAMIIS
jgi:geranylgeranylglycerol-phosphate geranylgeranyltransferase